MVAPNVNFRLVKQACENAIEVEREDRRAAAAAKGWWNLPIFLRKMAGVSYFVVFRKKKITDE